MRVAFSLLIILISMTVLNARDIIGTIQPLRGTPKFGGVFTRSINSKSPLENGAIVKTSKGSSAKAFYNDGSVVKITPESTVTFKKNSIRIRRGKTNLNFVKMGKTFRIFVPNASIGLYGTSLDIEVLNQDWTQISLLEGRIWIQATEGNRKKIDLEKGYTVAVTNEGIVEKPVKFKRETGTKKSGTGDIETASVEYQKNFEGDLQINGNLAYRIEPVLDNSFRILIDGYPSLNGKELVYNSKETVLLENLQQGRYEITLIANGIENIFFIDINPSTNRGMKTIRYSRKVVGIQIGSLKENENIEQLRNHVELTIIHNGVRTLIQYYEPGDPRDYGFETKRYGRDKLGRFLITMPKGLKKRPLLEIKYTGDIPVEKNSIKLKFKGGKYYNVRF